MIFFIYTSIAIFTCLMLQVKVMWNDRANQTADDMVRMDARESSIEYWSARYSNIKYDREIDRINVVNQQLASFRRV